MVVVVVVVCVCVCVCVHVCVRTASGWGCWMGVLCLICMLNNLTLCKRQRKLLSISYNPPEKERRKTNSEVKVKYNSVKALTNHPLSRKQLKDQENK